MPMIPEWATFLAYLKDRVVRHSSLVCPVMVLWRDYRAYCEEWGFEPVRAEEFMTYVGLLEGTEVGGNGSGRLRRVVTGLGLRPKDPSSQMRDTG